MRQFFLSLCILIINADFLSAQYDYEFKPTIAVLPFTINSQYIDPSENKTVLISLLDSIDVLREELAKTKKKKEQEKIQNEINTLEDKYNAAYAEWIKIEDAAAIRNICTANIKKLDMFDVLPYEDLDAFISERNIILTEIYRPAYYTLFAEADIGFIFCADIETVEIKNEKNYRVVFTLINIKSGTFYKSDTASMKTTGQGITNGINAMSAKFFSRINLTYEDLIKAVHEPDYKTGYIGPAGGIIFFVKSNHSGGWRYLEAAPEDSPPLAWGAGDTGEPDVKGTTLELGEGLRNTNLIVSLTNPNGTDTTAAQYCFLLSIERDGKKYDDWFLPSLNELNILCRVLKAEGKGGLKDASYWSSSQSAAKTAWFETFNNGRVYPNGYKGDKLYVRAIRAF